MIYQELLANLSEFYTQIKMGLFAILPNIIFALGIILIGLLIGRILQSLLRRFINNLDRFISSGKMRMDVRRINLERSARLLGKVIFWVIFIIFLTLATHVLGLPIITTWLGGIVNYLPDIMIAVVIVFLGILGGTLLRDVITAASATAGLMYSKILGRIAQYTILLITILIAADQVGVNIEFLTEVIDIIFAAILFGAALAFGLGARTSVSNILASYYLQSRYEVGHTIKIGNVEGTIIQITPTAVILDTLEGHVSIPAKKFSEMTSMLVRKEGNAV